MTEQSKTRHGLTHDDLNQLHKALHVLSLYDQAIGTALQENGCERSVQYEVVNALRLLANEKILSESSDSDTQSTI